MCVKFLAHVRCSRNTGSLPLSRARGRAGAQCKQPTDTPQATSWGPDLQIQAVTPTGSGMISAWSSCSPECRHDLHSHRDNSKLD